MQRAPLSHAPRGYSLPMVIMLMSVLAAAGAAAVVALTSTAETTATMINRRQAFYACDGIGRAAMVSARQYMRTTAAPDTTGLMNFVCGSTTGCPNQGNFQPAGYQINNLQLSTNGGAPVSPLPNGPFQGMNARQTNLTIAVQATKTATNARCQINENIVLGEIALFQFFVFANGFTDLVIPPAMNINGRVHVNGDFCGYSDNTLTIGRITASGRIFARTGCAQVDPITGTATAMNTFSGGAGTFFVPNAAGVPQVFQASNSSGCTTCTPGPETGTWQQYALTRWGGNVQDSFHQVPFLRLPVVGQAAVPDGLDASGNGVDNSLSLRMLLDPVRPGDSDQVLQQRYAANADIVIINGIWFRRQNGVPWPGTPIWSDHPGAYTTPTNCNDNDEGAVTCNRPAVNVGQAQLFPGATPRPVRYSYYRHNGSAIVATAALSAPDMTRRPIVSYGPLVRTGGAPQYLPAFMNAAGTPTAVNNGLAATHPVQILDGARSGFKDFRVDAGVGATTLGKLLPMNFDIAAFAAALADTSPGELGSQPWANGVAGFNGIVYITNTWPGWDQNISTAGSVQTPPSLWPRVDDAGVATPNITLVNTAAGFNAAIESQRLPHNFCHTGASPPPLLAGAVLTAPSCGHASLTRPNAVRIINGATINTTVFPRGLAIATNNGVYIVGDLNTSSITFTGAAPPAASIQPNPLSSSATFPSTGAWRPLMVGGDAVTLLSNNWNDFDADWSDPRNATQLALRDPTTTTWAYASIAGSVPTSTTAPSGGINNFPRFLEDWNIGANPATRIFGSLVIGFSSVYQRQPFVSTTPSLGVYTAPDRDWLYDPNFNLPNNQPPGTPSFFVQAIQSWSRS